MKRFFEILKYGFLLFLWMNPLVWGFTILEYKSTTTLVPFMHWTRKHFVRVDYFKRRLIGKNANFNNMWNNYLKPYIKAMNDFMDGHNPDWI